MECGSLPDAPPRIEKTVRGWTVRIQADLLKEQAEATANALRLLDAQLGQIEKTLPQAVLPELRKVPLYFSLPYPGFRPTAEYHPNSGWLKRNQRDPAMAQAVEFTNVAQFEHENRRMPWFVLHELAHAYHHRVLGHDDRSISEAFQAAQASGKYENVEQRMGDGQSRMGRSYALSNDKEYFAEGTEAFFGVNDFFPFHADQLKRHDPKLYAVLKRVWRVP